MINLDELERGAIPHGRDDNGYPCECSDCRGILGLIAELREARESLSESSRYHARVCSGIEQERDALLDKLKCAAWLVKTMSRQAPITEDEDNYMRVIQAELTKLLPP